MSTPLDIENHSHAIGKLDFSAFQTLVVAHAEVFNEEAEMRESWRAFKEPTKGSAMILVDIQSLIGAASAADYNTGIESIRFSDKGNVNLRRQKKPGTHIFEYKLQLISRKPPHPVEEVDVHLTTIVTAVRAGVSLLAAALAADVTFATRVKAVFLKDQELAAYERNEINFLIEDAKTPHNPRRGSL